MHPVLHGIDAVVEMVKNGEVLLLAGDETLLKNVPEGQWIGGTIPYFMGHDGGEETRESLHVVDLSKLIESARISTYTEATLPSLYGDACGNGFSIIIVPAESVAHRRFALDAPSYSGFATKPLIGWVAGVHVSEIGKAAARVFSGDRPSAGTTDGAVVLHAALPVNEVADIGIVNIFEQGDGETIEFQEDGFGATVASVDGTTTNFGKFIKDRGIDTRFPLVASYCGAMVNTSFQSVNAQTGEVHFYAPVFAGVKYRLAKPVDDYVGEFASRIPERAGNIMFSCNCILNYLYSDLKGRKTGDFTGPFTFGEIAYQLLNQTLTYLSINARVEAQNG